MEIGGKTAFVTGGGSGLGRATAEALAAAGAHVMVFDLDGAAAEKVAGRIGGLSQAGDVCSEGDVAAALDACAARHEPPRIVVNCAGIAPAARIVGREGAMPLDVFRRVVEVNLIGSFNVLRMAAARMADLPALAGGSRGVIVNTASVAAFDGQIGQAAYAASKGGVVSLALPAARELARSGIRVNTVAPGIFRTPMLESLPGEVQQSLGQSVPFPARLGEPAEYAAAVLFAVANDYLNGEVIRLDGALRMAPK